MSQWSGNGGDVVVGVVTLNIGKWTLRKGARLAENTHSAKSATNFETVVPDYSGSIEIPWDDTNLPDTDVGLEEGAKVTIVLHYGLSGKFQTLTDTSIETCEDVDDNANDIIRTVVTFKGGTLTRAIT